jgi:hypothetical protein
MKCNSEFVAAWYGTVITALLEDLLESVDSLAGPGSKAIHQAGVPRVRTVKGGVCYNDWRPPMMEAY